VTQNRFEVLALEEQENVLMQTADAQLFSPTIKTSPIHILLSSTKI